MEQYAFLIFNCYGGHHWIVLQNPNSWFIRLSEARTKNISNSSLLTLVSSFQKSCDITGKSLTIWNMCNPSQLIWIMKVDKYNLQHFTFSAGFKGNFFNQENFRNNVLSEGHFLNAFLERFSHIFAVEKMASWRKNLALSKLP